MRRGLKCADRPAWLAPGQSACRRENPDEEGTEMATSGSGGLRLRRPCRRENPDEEGTEIESHLSASVSGRGRRSRRENPDEEGTESGARRGGEGCLKKSAPDLHWLAGRRSWLRCTRP